jgi:hypothetical protein
MRILFPLSLLLLFSCRQNTPPPPVVPSEKGAVENAVVPPPTTVPQGGEYGLRAFVPTGYEILDSATGDLNGDAYTDCLLVLKKPDEEAQARVSEDPEKRPLLVLTGTAGGGLQLAARNDNTVYCVSCGGMMGDPYMGLTIKNGYFSVEHYGGSAWRWTHITTFKWSAEDKTWLLHKDGGESFHALEPDKVETDVKTQKDFGKVPFEQFDTYKEKDQEAE